MKEFGIRVDFPVWASGTFGIKAEDEAEALDKVHDLVGRLVAARNGGKPEFTDDEEKAVEELFNEAHEDLDLDASFITMEGIEIKHDPEVTESIAEDEAAKAAIKAAEEAAGTRLGRIEALARYLKEHEGVYVMNPVFAARVQELADLVLDKDKEAEA